ncbi:MAG: M56 family metallopeptidase [Planctomycetales bacterium]
MTTAIWVIQNTALATLLALGVTAACRWGKLSPAIRHALWLVVLIKLVTPPLVEIPLPLGWLLPPSGETVSVERSAAARDKQVKQFVVPDTPRATSGETRPELARQGEQPSDGESLFESFEAWTETRRVEVAEAEPIEMPRRDANSRIEASATVHQHSISPDAETAHLPPQDEVAATAHWWSARSFPEWLFWGWCAGTAIVALVQGARLFNLWRLIAHGKPADESLRELVASAAAQMRITPPPLRVVAKLATPALCAFGPATLLWPDRALDQLSLASRRAVVLHELAHLARRDHWVSWLELLAGCTWWWNPLFWYVRHQLHDNAELACDSWVVALLPEGRREYAEALIDVAQGPQCPQVSGMVLGVGDGSRKLMERRLTMIMRGNTRYQIPLAGLVLIGMAGMASLPGWSIGQEPPASVPEAPVNPVGTSDPIVPSRTSAAPTTNSSDEGILTPTNNPFESIPSAPTRSTGTAPAAGRQNPNSVPSDNPVAPRTTAVATDPNVVTQPIPKTAIPMPRSSALRKTPITVSPPVRLEDPTAFRRPKRAFDPHADVIRLQEQIAVLSAQLEALRSSAAVGSDGPAAVAVPRNSVPTDLGERLLLTDATADVPGVGGPAPGTLDRSPSMKWIPSELVPLARSATPTDDEVVTVTITRASYRLSKGRGEVLAKFLTEHLNDDVEVRVKGDFLQVTATPEDQAAVAHLIRLVQRKARADAPHPATDRFAPPINELPRPTSSNVPANPDRTGNALNELGDAQLPVSRLEDTGVHDATLAPSDARLPASDVLVEPAPLEKRAR